METTSATGKFIVQTGRDLYVMECRVIFQCTCVWEIPEIPLIDLQHPNLQGFCDGS